MCVVCYRPTSRQSKNARGRVSDSLLTESVHQRKHANELALRSAGVDGLTLPGSGRCMGYSFLHYSSTQSLIWHF